jgi:hypothetical protein
MHRSKVRNLFFGLLVSVAFTSPIQSVAQTTDEAAEDEETIDLFDEDVELTELGWPRFRISAGAAQLDADGVFAAQIPGGPTVPLIDFNLIGLDDSDSTHWLSVIWRSTESRWGVWFANWRYDVGGERMWEQELAIPDKPVIPVGARVRSDFDTKWYILEATYSFWRTETLDAGIGFGLHTVDFDIRLHAQVEAGEEQREFIGSDLDAIAPLPNIVGYVYWKPLPRWRLDARVGWFGLEYDRYDGKMTNADVMISYELSERFSLGAGYNFVHLDLDIEKSKYTQVYDVDFDGPMAFVRMRF